MFKCFDVQIANQSQNWRGALRQKAQQMKKPFATIINPPILIWDKPKQDALCSECKQQNEQHGDIKALFAWDEHKTPDWSNSKLEELEIRNRQQSATRFYTEAGPVLITYNYLGVATVPVLWLQFDIMVQF